VTDEQAAAPVGAAEAAADGTLALAADDPAGAAPAGAMLAGAGGPRPQPLVAALIAVLAGAALAAGAQHSATTLLVAVAIAQAALVGAWTFGAAIPGRIGSLLIGGGVAAGADTVVVVWPHGRLGALLPVLGLVVLTMFVHQLIRGVVRTRVVESLSDITLVVVAVAALPALLQLRHEFAADDQPDRVASAVVGAAAAALVVGFVVDAVVSRPRIDAAVPRGLPAVILAGIAAALVGWARLHHVGEFAGWRDAVVGAVVGLTAVLVSVGASFAEAGVMAPPRRWRRQLRLVFADLFAFAAVAPVGYVLCLAIRR
jgi:hypothetical protein